MPPRHEDDEPEDAPDMQLDTTRLRHTSEDAQPTRLRPDTFAAASRTGGWGLDLGSMQLPAGTRLFEYEITGTIGQGGFGVVYRAFDHLLKREVAIKEYLPATMALRSDAGTVTLASQAHSGAFQAGLSSFVNEARLLAQFDHPSLVKVFRFWEANGTAYMVMPLYDGVTLKQHLQQEPAVSQRALENWLRPLLDALETLHNAHVYHRDIAPDNILILKDGRPVLLDFGAARQRIGEMTHGMTVIIKPGYAPIEQYAQDVSSRQGPWTDIYALAAVMYYAITRSVPPASVTRVSEDSLTPLAREARAGFSSRFLATLDRALRVHAKERPQSIPEFRQQLLGESAREAGAQPKRASAQQKLTLHSIGIGLIAIAVLCTGVATWWHYAHKSAPAQENLAADDSPAPVKAPPQPVPPVVEHAAPPPRVRAAFTPVSALQEVAEHSAPGLAPRISVTRPRVVADRDQVQFTVASPSDGYLYVLMYDTDGKLYVLFPNAIDHNNRVTANASVQLPRPGWSIVATPPFGVNRLLAIVSPTPRDFSTVGLTTSGDFGEISLAAAARAYSTHQAAWPLLAGEPVCDRACSGEYGAVAFNIEVVKR